MPRVLLLAFTILFTSTLGCGGPEKELPKDIATAKGREKEIEPAAPIPTTSQPDGVKLVEKCLAAATEGYKERLDKLKANRLIEQGTMLRDMRHVPTTRKIAAVWPDRYFYSNESTGADPLNISIGLRQGSLAFRQNDFVPTQAKKANVQAGDLIVGVDGQTLEMDCVDFVHHVQRRYLIGETIVVEVIREGRRLQLPMKLLPQ